MRNRFLITVLASASIVALAQSAKAEPVSLATVAATTAVATATNLAVQSLAEQIKKCRVVVERVSIGAFGAKWGETDTAHLQCD